MTDTAESTATDFSIASIRTPEMEMAERGADVPAAADLEIDEINPTNPHLFRGTVGKNTLPDLELKTPCISMNLRHQAVTGHYQIR